MAAGLYGLLNQMDFRRKGLPVPGRQIDEDTAAYHILLSRGQLVHQQAVPGGTRYAVKTSEPYQDCLHFPGRNQGAVHAVSLHNGNSASGSPAGDKRNSGLADILYIPVDGPAGYLKLFRQIGGGYLFPLEKDGQDSDETVYFHGWRPSLSCFQKHRGSVTCPCAFLSFFAASVQTGVWLLLPYSLCLPPSCQSLSAPAAISGPAGLSFPGLTPEVPS